MGVVSWLKQRMNKMVDGAGKGCSSCSHQCAWYLAATSEGIDGVPLENGLPNEKKEEEL